ncbi:UDP-glucose 4-epimerase GalE [Companilactobacillus furfuricola]|uniref:UDP-glucose 4-epimerase GalE n=1 Tax=Companilactobacillus furfuricola TaxID=1462575 RepID=UPI000F7975C4|nr:UDP-glucose 4-epimerase GalE [Companilactobacillus furfuricola]
MNILITGGAGYIGSNIYLSLFNNGYQPIIVDNFSNSDTRRIEELETLTKQHVKYFECDIRDIDAMEEILKSNDIVAVIDAAGYKVTSESVASPLKYYKNNTNGVIDLLIAMQQANVKKIVFSSSASVYGDAKILPVNEESETIPVSPYGTTKLQSEQVIKDLVIADPEWSAISLRYFNPIGMDKSGMLDDYSNNMTNNVYDSIREVLDGKRDHLDIFGNDYDTVDGTPVRDYIHITDLADGHISALNRVIEAKDSFEIFNLGCGNGVTVLELKKIFEDHTKKEIPSVFKGRRAGDAPVSYADITKAEKILGWKPIRTLAGEEMSIE